MLVNLKTIFRQYQNQCIAAFNVFGYEDAVSVIKASEELNQPVILMANKPAILHMPIPIIGDILCKLAEASSVPVCVHLDHSTCLSDISTAINHGFSSVMFDGSQLDYAENVARTIEVVEFARRYDVSVEAEIGSVGYNDPDVIAKAEYTNPAQAKSFALATQVDALAIAVGTVHRMVTQNAAIKFELIDEIRRVTDVPLVIHGSSGVKDEDLTRLAKHGIRKINLGTALRMAFGNSIRQTLSNDPDVFDRIAIFKPAMDAVYLEAKKKILALANPD